MSRGRGNFRTSLQMRSAPTAYTVGASIVFGAGRYAPVNGQQYTYGFYPRGTIDENHTQIPGCLHHPDQTHESCIDERLRSDSDTGSASRSSMLPLGVAQGVCRTGHMYGIARSGRGWDPSYTCTTFARDALAAGSSR
jgi:hypothetical protein